MTLNIKILYYKDPDLYFDIADLPDPFTFSIPLCITNNESIDLYFRAVLVNPPAGWEKTSVDLGLVSAGASKCLVANFTRTKPSLTDGEYDETVTLRIEAYTDSSYTDLYGYQDVSITIHFIDHNDPSWTVVDLDTFDDGSTEGWSRIEGKIDPTLSGYGTQSINICSDHYISSSYSICSYTSLGGYDYDIYKDFDLSVFSNKAYIIIHVYRTHQLAVKINDDLVLPKALGDLVPAGVWTRLVYPLKVGQTNRVIIGNRGNDKYQYVNRLDDIIVIAK